MILEKAVYFELRAYLGDLDTLDLDSLRQQETARQRRAAALARADALLRSLGLDPAQPIMWDDRTLTVIQGETGLPPSGDAGLPPPTVTLP